MPTPDELWNTPILVSDPEPLRQALKKIYQEQLDRRATIQGFVLGVLVGLIAWALVALLLSAVW